MQLLLAQLLLRLLALMPLKLLHALAVPLGWLAWRLPWRKHAVIDTNLARCFPEFDESARHRLHRQHLVEMMRLALESGAVWYWSKQRLFRHVISAEGWEHVEQHMAGGKGVLLVGAHFGNWEILPLFVSARMPFVALYKAPKRADLDAAVTTSRSRFGATLISSGSPAMRKMLAALRRGEAIGLLADQQPKQGEGVFAPLFGIPASTMTLVNRLARKTDAPVIFAHAKRITGQGWSIHFEPAGKDITAATPVEGIAPMHQWLEQIIRQHPTQYLWSYKRFSVRPPGESDFYPPRR
ncbi:lysophospholipid acyltransferase family protein [Wenzhouxiangella sp. AB-CW3]|uniref:lysophospholipid acyltransferase family protein n=1 Tax=Wenzhouxiangella sp. AB-CW3 TaxID=2771012 RepID=UPI00168AFE4A|nr:lysophospholipid acyltransferase family protein [Wenzhouxiangella sp. AB-CW3]QOC22283.1 lysophospholipid acyltransferase family protein [Wenzhouxiangella sp. AB-CW3]